MKGGMAGIFAALPTPFRSGEFDEGALRNIVRHVVSAGVNGLVACGTTAEATSLSRRERRRIIEVCLSEAGHLPVIVGTGTNNAELTVELTEEAKIIGAFAALVVTPYYVKPTQEGLYAHFAAVVNHTDFNVMIYNVPSRTGCSIAPETVISLAQDPRVIGIKEAEVNMAKVKQIADGTPADFFVLSGDDDTFNEAYDHGSNGVISVAANVVPRRMADVHTYTKLGATGAAKIEHAKLKKLIKALFKETSPAPLKQALKLMDLAENEVRLPLVPVQDATRLELETELTALGII